MWKYQTQKKKNCSVLVNLKEKKSFWFNFSCGGRDALYVAMTGGRVDCLRFKISNFIYFIGTYSCSARCQQSNRKKKELRQKLCLFSAFSAFREAVSCSLEASVNYQSEWFENSERNNIQVKYRMAVVIVWSLSFTGFFIFFPKVYKVFAVFVTHSVKACRHVFLYCRAFS